MPKRGKNYRRGAEKIEFGKFYDSSEALALLKECGYAKFDETVDVAVNLGVNPRHADQMVRGAVVYPHGLGKAVRVAVFAKGDKATEAKEAGADLHAHPLHRRQREEDLLDGFIVVDL